MLTPVASSTTKPEFWLAELNVKKSHATPDLMVLNSIPGANNGWIRACAECSCVPYELLKTVPCLSVILSL